MLVIKLGGEVIAGNERETIAADVAAIVETGARVVLVHGGGPQATKLQEQLGQAPVQIAGRRVTDEAALDVMKMVVAGKLNVDLCGSLLGAGLRPIGLNGTSASAIYAEKRPPRVYSGAGPNPVDLGLVGDVKSVNQDLIDLLLSKGFTPVLACLGATKKGQVLNINADIVANRVAAELRADGLILVSDVPGVMRDISDPESRIRSLTIREGRALISEGAVTKGMIVKLEEAFAALLSGVRRIHIVGKLGPGDLAREARTPGSVGTVLLP
ncbi:MAG: acetylglutamate kinase [Polyangiaceae bacterium]|nr:acetylglutamate kinase [Polyangiaceae bacterium]